MRKGTILKTKTSDRLLHPLVLVPRHFDLWLACHYALRWRTSGCYLPDPEGPVIDSAIRWRSASLSANQIKVGVGINRERTRCNWQPIMYFRWAVSPVVGTSLTTMWAPLMYLRVCSNCKGRQQQRLKNKEPEQRTKDNIFESTRDRVALLAVVTY